MTKPRRSRWRPVAGLPHNTPAVHAVLTLSCLNWLMSLNLLLKPSWFHVQTSFLMRIFFLLVHMLLHLKQSHYMPSEESEWVTRLISFFFMLMCVCVGVCVIRRSKIVFIMSLFISTWLYHHHSFSASTVGHKDKISRPKQARLARLASQPVGDLWIIASEPTT